MLDNNTSIYSKSCHDTSIMKCNYQFKILIIGEINVGKTALKIRYTENKFDPNTKLTTGIDFKVKTIYVSPVEIVKLSIWDTAGSEKYRSIAKSYLANAQGILLCFDITNKASFIEWNNFWINFINEYLEIGNETSNVSIVYLIGTKQDWKMNREVSEEEANNFANKFNGKYFETSAMTGDGVDIVFESLAQDLVDKYENNKKKNSNNDKIRLRRNSAKEKDKASYLSKYGTTDSMSSYCC